MQTTENYNLPIFEEGETPALIGDWNSTMRKIDNIGGGSGGGLVIDELLLLTSYTPAEINSLLEEYDFLIIGGGYISITADNNFTHWTPCLVNQPLATGMTNTLCYTRLGGSTHEELYTTGTDTTFTMSARNASSPTVYGVKL